MADGDAHVEKWKAEILALLQQLRQQQAKTYEITEQILKLAGGGPGTPNQTKAALARFGELWSARYRGEKYAFTWAKDGGQVKRLLKTFAFEDLTARMARYLENTDPFVTSRRHPLQIFIATVNTYGRAQAREPIVGCQHQPPCGTETEHTARRMAEMRGGSHSGPVGDVL
jgi:hypothetical protein